MVRTDWFRHGVPLARPVQAQLSVHLTLTTTPCHAFILLRIALSVEWTWQSLGFGSRDNALAGTFTFMNNPRSRNTTLEDVIDLGNIGVPNITIAGAMNTLAGPFCYVYACIKRREVNRRQRLHSVSAPAVLLIDHKVAVLTIVQ